jgi:hypothetical protein
MKKRRRIMNPNESSSLTSESHACKVNFMTSPSSVSMRFGSRLEFQISKPFDKVKSCYLVDASQFLLYADKQMTNKRLIVDWSLFYVRINLVSAVCCFMFEMEK